ncbi:MAG: hypothetical protein LBT20_08380, partial [Clostridiales bacterium]|nr:hypothetical protein [Clostridiales bacterium]
MKILSLNGQWHFKEKDGERWYKAQVPGSNFTDLLENGLIPDPFIGTNEKDDAVQAVGLKDWVYKRYFDADDGILRNESIELVFDGLDTLAEVFLNGKKVLSANNRFKRYIVDVKPYLTKSENEIIIVFSSPIKYARAEREKNKLMMSFDAIAPAQYIRKPQYHFGWDWGPQLPPSGIAEKVYIRAYGKAKLGETLFRQTHNDGAVFLNISVPIEKRDGDVNHYTVQTEIITPLGETFIEGAEASCTGAQIAVNILNPVLWQPNGLTAKKTQPLYRINVYLLSNGAVIETKDYDIGLRTVELDRSVTEWGSSFAFVVNGRRIFAKGGNWIPADSFTERVSYEKLDRLIRDMRDANMNMVRVWGGGFYESDDFYALCDKYGILVWQDCCFACQPYPLTDDEFVKNIEDEIYYNIERIRHHASLALYCGNNELEQMAISWRFNKPLKEAMGRFFYEILPDWIQKKDSVTPYWASSPSGGSLLKGVNSESEGDTHLWRVWHGLSPYTYYRKVYTNFCAEFGMQSLPTMNTIRAFAKPEDYDLSSAVMKNHQKNMAGNSIMKYYLVSDFRSPKEFSDLVYLTQVVQAECMREPVEHWRRNMGRCNGALYWQFNDCWPVSSWSSVDYYGNYKALQYAAKDFNEPLTVSIENDESGATLYLVNETFADYHGSVSWNLQTFSGEILAEGRIEGKEVETDANTARKLARIDFSEIFKRHGTDCVFAANLERNDGIETRKTALFKKAKDLSLPKSEITVAAAVENGEGIIRLTSKYFARFVKLELDGITEPFSDNFFDILAGETRTVTIAVPPIWEDSDLKERLSVRSVADVPA